LLRDGRVSAGFLQLEAAVCGVGNELRELWQLCEENRKLNGIVADLTLDKHILQEVQPLPFTDGFLNQS
jgi:hypothetical protein